METLDQLAGWLSAQQQRAEENAEEFAPLGDEDPSASAEQIGRAQAFKEAHEKVMLLVQAEEAPSVESTLPIEEVMALFLTNPVLTVDTCEAAGLDRGDAQEALKWLAADGRLSLSVEGHAELWSLA